MTHSERQFVTCATGTCSQSHTGRGLGPAMETSHPAFSRLSNQVKENIREGTILFESSTVHIAIKHTPGSSVAYHLRTTQITDLPCRLPCITRLTLCPLQPLCSACLCNSVRIIIVTRAQTVCRINPVRSQDLSAALRIGIWVIER